MVGTRRKARKGEARKRKRRERKRRTEGGGDEGCKAGEKIGKRGDEWEGTKWRGKGKGRGRIKGGEESYEFSKIQDGGRPPF